MANEITLAFRAKEERYQDKEMVPNPTLSLFVSFISVSPLSITSNPISISPRLTRDWL
jgi:hypothetical protein